MMSMTLILFFGLVQFFSKGRPLTLFFLLLAQITFGVSFFIHTLIRNNELTIRCINICFYLFSTTVLSAVLIAKDVRLEMALLLELPLILIFWSVNLWISKTRESRRKEQAEKENSRNRRIMVRLQLLEEKEKDRIAKSEIRRLIQIIFLQGVSDYETLEEKIRQLEIVMQGEFYSPEHRDEKLVEIHQYLLERALDRKGEEQ